MFIERPYTFAFGIVEYWVIGCSRDVIFCILRGRTHINDVGKVGELRGGNKFRVFHRAVGVLDNGE